MSRFAVTYEIITPESAAEGDAAERGYAAEGVSLREALRVAGGGFEPSDSRIGAGTWFTTIDPDWNYRTGEATYYAIHAPRGTSVASLRRIARALGCRVRP